MCPASYISLTPMPRADSCVIRGVEGNKKAMYRGTELCPALCAVKGEAGLRGSAVSRFEGGGYFGVASPSVCKGKLFNQPSSKVALH